MGRCPPRLAGLVLLAASGATTALHRLVWESVRHGPAPAVEMALGLSTFALASMGMLLLIHGGKLFTREIPATGKGADAEDSLAGPAQDVGHAFDTRHGVAAIQARALLASAAASNPARRDTSQGASHRVEAK